MSSFDPAETPGGGDRAAFAALVAQHQSRLRGFLRRLTKGDAALADDLAQETFLEAWRKRARFEGRGAFAGWLLRIAWSRYLMEARKRKLEPLGDDDQALERFAARDVDQGIDLERSLAQLSAGERAGITLCYALGYPHEEAARILEMPLGTLKSHVARGREKLKRMMGGGR